MISKQPKGGKIEVKQASLQQIRYLYQYTILIFHKSNEVKPSLCLNKINIQA